MARHALSHWLPCVAVLAVLWVGGCGRFGYELLPSAIDQQDGGVRLDEAGRPLATADASLDAQGACAGGSCSDACSECGCGVAVTDGDGDGTPDCVDECPSDANKSRAGLCGCGVSEQDTDLDGTPDCLDRCTGVDPAYTADQSCGLGYCLAHNTASTCVMGVETLCQPGAPLATSDTTCDGVDDDCDGVVDDDYPAVDTTCGLGACAGTGKRTCVGGQEVDSCQPDPSKASPDTDCDAFDDDCDGVADDDFAVITNSCGAGACLATGTIQCVNGTTVDSCVTKTSSATSDVTCNNIDDDCDGRVDEDYVVTSTSCGAGACKRSGQRTCVSGREVDSCSAGTPSVSKDTSCNGIDDDCDGVVDDDYVVTSTSCGTGYCASSGQRTCVGGTTRDSCTPRAPRTSTDDAFSPGNGVDDDCDGSVDEDVPPCNTAQQTFEAGQYTVAVPGNCKSLTVRLWGGAGASGQSAGVSGGGGSGGAGGYASATALVSGTINLYVGNGAAGNCNNAGTNPGSSSYNGGAGGTGAGLNGADGAVGGGGSGGSSSSGYSGGRGYYGGGGGGQGRGGLGASGNGGGGGAASVLLVNGTRVAVAGGGGGGGGAQAITLLGTLAASGGAGGAGCSGGGNAPEATSGGGGGGGVCQGSTVTRGSGITPANSGSIPGGRARGGSGSCVAGGNGYATITFAP